MNVVGAVVVRDGLVLCTQRGSGALAGKWEFPGGKVEEGEAPRAALEREIREELLCEVRLGELVAGEPQLTEHTDARWLRPDELMSLDWAPADVPAVEKIREQLTTRLG